MRWLDEAVVSASSEDLHLPISEGWAFCCLISTCAGIGDFQRAAEWCMNTLRFTDRWGGRQLLGVCRSNCGRVLATSRRQPAAEVGLAGAVEDLRSTRPGMAAGGLARLGELRARQGREREGPQLYEQAGAAGLSDSAGSSSTAATPSWRGRLPNAPVRGIPERAILERLPAEELLCRALIVADRPDDAEAPLAAVRASAKLIGTPYVGARAAFSKPRSRRRPETARRPPPAGGRGRRLQRLRRAL